MSLKINLLRVLRDCTVIDYDNGNKVKIRPLATLETKLAHLDHLKRTARHDSTVVEPGRPWPSGLRGQRGVGLMSTHGFEPHQCHFETLCHSPSG